MTATFPQGTGRVLATTSTYIALYVALDLVSHVQVLPDVGLTLWNPPPACSLALLLTKGLHFAPALFPAAVLADVLNGKFSHGVLPSLVTNVVIAVGYTAVGAALWWFPGRITSFRTTAGVAGFLAIIGLGVFVIALLVGFCLVLMRAIPPDGLVATVRHFYIGDVTGIVGLLPVLMTAPSAWQRAGEMPAHRRFVDPALFVLGLAFALWVVFKIGVPNGYRFFYLLLLPTIWIGVRQGLAWVAMAILIEQIALIVIVELHQYSVSEVSDFQILSLVLSVTGLLLGAAVTERQDAELRLRQQQAELGRMARLTTAGALGTAIVHEISQPLATVATYVHACRISLDADSWEQDSLRETLGRAESQALRAGQIVSRLRDFLASNGREVSAFDITHAAEEVVAILADEARSSGVSVSIIKQGAAIVSGDRLQMEQVLLNLIRNAIEAAAESCGGRKQVWVRVRSAEGKAQVEVDDTGSGVSPEIAQRLFEPFTTGKPKGMGLGLLLSREIIRFHGGDLWLDRSVQTGARFAFRVPADVGGARCRVDP